MVVPRSITADEIEAAYRYSGNRLGWRFLHSPARVVAHTPGGFLGQNPGGGHEPAGHPRLAPSQGSDCTDERRQGYAPCRSPLQQQVCNLFRALWVDPARVLAGNLVPHRYPSFDVLREAERSIACGRSLWSRVFRTAHPSRVVKTGHESNRPVSDLLGAARSNALSLGWGDVTGRKWSFAGGDMAHLPHLSRFRVIDRPQSWPGLAILFGRHWRMS